jgi:hypothetical protein
VEGGTSDRQSVDFLKSWAKEKKKKKALSKRKEKGGK